MTARSPDDGKPQPPVVELREPQPDLRQRSAGAGPARRRPDDRPGDWMAIVGPSGSGKSTLLNILGCLDRPTSGTYLIDGIDAGEPDATSERAALRGQMIGFIFQTFHLLAIARRSRT